MDIPWYIWALVLIILSPWIVGGIITTAVFLFATFCGLVVAVLKLAEPFERRYYATEFGKERRRKRWQKKQAKRIAKRRR